MAGLVAGITAAERGKQIMLVAEGVGSLSFASGIIDFGDYDTLKINEASLFSDFRRSSQRSNNQVAGNMPFL